MTNQKVADAIFRGLSAGPCDGDEDFQEEGDMVDLIQSHSGHWSVYSAGISMEEHHRSLSQAQEWACENGYTVDAITPWTQR